QPLPCCTRTVCSQPRPRHGCNDKGDDNAQEPPADTTPTVHESTAGEATVGATREAGVTSGGDFALDGLVRAFVGAGGRTVLASHWPVPDEFDATKRLISGLFVEGSPETAEALRRSQVGLMDDPSTSHPFYWSAFAVIGDGTIAVNR
ncbi:MAG: CHAT domain-containing protein, partial [Pseudomonadota bacterium]